MSRSTSSTPPFTIAELVTGGGALLTVSVTAWAWAGRATWAPLTFTALALLTTIAALAFSRQSPALARWHPGLPVLAFTALAGLSLLNRSHLPVPDQPGSWVANPAWVSWLPATVDRATTLGQLLPWLAALLLGTALRLVPFSRRFRNLFWAALVAHGLALALTGIYSHLASPHQVLGLFRDRHGYHFSSFIYRNHWTAYVILLVPLSLGFAFTALERWRARRGRWDAVLPGFAGGALLGITPIIPGSRSGMLVMSAIMVIAFGMAALAVIRTRAHGLSTRQRLGRVCGLLALSSLVVLALYPVLGQPLAQHWQRTVHQARGHLAGQEELRFLITRDTLHMAAQRPLWGWGLGSYAHVFPVYQGNYLRDAHGQITTRVVHAHNDWAQVLAETGGIGLLVLVLPLIFLLARSARQREPLERWTLGGLLLLLIYAGVDFPLHSPAVLLLFTALLCTHPTTPLLPVPSSAPHRRQRPTPLRSKAPD